MQRLVSTDRVHVFAEPGTPARSLSERVVLIGHLFPKHAEQLGCLTSSRSDASVFQQLLDDFWGDYVRSEEHTSELPVTNAHLVCRLLLEKKKTKQHQAVQIQRITSNIEQQKLD